MGLVDSEDGKQFENLILVNIPSMVNVKDDRGFGVLEIKKRPVAPGDTKRQSAGDHPHRLYVETRIAPVVPEAFLLSRVKPLDFLREFLE